MFIEQQIRMISEGSRETEKWSNYVENSALRHRNKFHFNNIFKLFWIVILFYNLTVFYCIF